MNKEASMEPMNSLAMSAMTELQRDRFSRIITATQSLIEEIGAEKLTVKDVADASRVAASTLYSRFGTKHGLLAAAAVDHYERAIHHRFQQLRTGTFLGKVKAMVQSVVASVDEAPRFTRALTSAYFTLTEDSTMQVRLAAAVKEAWLRIVSAMQDDRLLRPWVSVDLLADDLRDREFVMVFRWAQGHIAEHELQDRLENALLVPILAASKGQLQIEVAEALSTLSLRLDGAQHKQAVVPVRPPRRTHVPKRSAAQR